MYRTEQLKKIFVPDVYNIDFITILNALRLGDIHVSDEILMHRYDGGVSTQGFFKYAKSRKLNFIQAISSNYPFTRWCFRKFGYTLCLKNLDLFILWNIEPLFFLMVNIVRKMSGDKTELVLNQKSN